MKNIIRINKRYFCNINKNIYNFVEKWSEHKSLNNINNFIKNHNIVSYKNNYLFYRELNKLNAKNEYNFNFNNNIFIKKEKEYNEEIKIYRRLKNYYKIKNIKWINNLFYYIFLFYLLYTIFYKYKGKNDPKILDLEIISKLSLDNIPEIVKDTKFGDVKGIDEYKEELEEIILYLKNPNKFKKLGAELPKGILLTGLPGTGKTLLARALAGESNTPFFYKSGSEFEEIYVGVGAQKIKKLFSDAKKCKTAIIFIDEIDSIGGKRNEYDDSLSRQAINQILTEMDGFNSKNNIIVIGATNLEDSLDPAIKRPGRFDKIIRITPPSFKGRKEILKYYLSKIKYDKNLNYENWAKRLIGFTGSDIKNFVNLAVLNAIKNNKTEADEENFDFSYDRIQMGIRDKNKMVNKEELLSTAYHEIGHAFIALNSKGSNPVYKVTILPSGGSLGHTALIANDELNYFNKISILASIDTMLGGRMAEEIFFNKNKTTTGVSNDLKNATELAYHYIRSMGFDENKNLVSEEYKELSEDYNYLIDKAVQNLLNERSLIVKNKLFKNKSLIKEIVKQLLQKETLTGKELNDIIENY